MTTRRGFITGLISLAVTAPAIVRATSLMPVKAEPPLTLAEYLPTIGYRAIGIDALVKIGAKPPFIVASHQFTMTLDEYARRYLGSA